MLLENYLSMICDYPDAYIGEPGFEILKNIPTIWDKTYVPAAKVDEYVSIARSKNDVWYIGTITNQKAREIKLKLDFLPAGKYTAEIYSDAPDADVNANHLIKKIKAVNNTTVLNLVLSSGGGNVIILHKLKNK